MTVPATPKQHDFVAGLAAAKAIDPAAAEAVFNAALAESFTKDEARELIDNLMGEADREVPEGTHVAPEGSPWAGQKIVVKRSKAGRLYTTLTDGEYLNGKGLFLLTADTLVAEASKPAELDEGAIYVTEDGRFIKVVRSQRGSLYGKVFSEETGKWEYAPALLNGLDNDDKVNAEQAAAFGKQHNRCVFCTRSLADERSRNVGYGPDCADNNGLPWGA